MNLPLVTVAVTAYFSADTLEETLESIVKQTYSSIELIISDDCSKDQTIAIAKEWLSKASNNQRFVRTELITVPKNTGVSANCNRCINAARGEWVKFIAGDDILLSNCIEDNINYALANPNASILFSQVKVFKHNFEPDNYWKTSPSVYPNNLMHKDYSAQDQHEILLFSDRIHYTPSYMFKKTALVAVGGYDENNRLIEDYPMWLKLTKAGQRLDYFEKPTVGYRMHDKALNNQVTPQIFKPLSLKAFLVRKEAAHPYLPWEIGYKERIEYWVKKLFLQLNWNKPTPLYNSLYRLFTVYLNPFVYVYAVKKRLPQNKNSHFYL